MKKTKKMTDAVIEERLMKDIHNLYKKGMESQGLTLEEPENRLCLFVDIERLNILTCTDEDLVILKTEFRDENDLETECALCIDRSEFLYIIEEWLDRKQEYYVSTDGTCAGQGYIGALNYVELFEDDALYYTKCSDPDEEPKNVYYLRTFFVTDLYVDMEHG